MFYEGGGGGITFQYTWKYVEIPLVVISQLYKYTLSEL